MQTLDHVREVIGRCKYLDWNLDVKLDGTRWYLQVRAKTPDCNTGELVEWTGRKWMLGPHMVDNELITTAYKAVMMAVEHEVRENFRYRGVAVQNPHVNYDKLAEFISDPANIEERADSLYGV